MGPAVWGLLMLTKVFFRVRLNTIGFVYAMPAVMLLIVLFQGFVPQYFKRVYPKVSIVQPLVWVLAVLFFVAGLLPTTLVYQKRYFHVRAGSDTLICNGSTGPEIREIASFIKDADKIMGKDANFVVFPQGVMLNFLTKKPDPLPYIIFESAELARYGEQNMLRSFIELKPEYVVLANEGIFPYYDPPLDADISHVIKAWILENYSPVWPINPEAGNMITVLKRQDGKKLR